MTAAAAVVAVAVVAAVDVGWIDREHCCCSLRNDWKFCSEWIHDVAGFVPHLGPATAQRLDL